MTGGPRADDPSSEGLDSELRRYAATGDPAARERLVLAHLHLVRVLARRFARRSEPPDDLEQVASIGLLKAVDGFDPEMGSAFSAYATRTILGELKRYFRDRGWSVRAPRRIQELYLELAPALEELSQRFGRSPSVVELSEFMGASQDDVLEALEAGRSYRAASLDEPGPDGEPRQAKLGGDDEALSAAENRQLLRPALARLPEREQRIVQLRFFEDLTQAEIASRLGISQMHVSRLLARSLDVLRHAYHETE